MKRVFVAGHKGMVGSAICRQLENTPVLKLLPELAKNLIFATNKQF